MLHLAVEDLPGELPRLIQNDAAVLRVGVVAEVRSLVDEAPALGVDVDPPWIGMLLELVADREVAEQFQKHSYPWGVYINAEGRRFVDEGADFRNYTYAKYGRVILQQPRQFAWQIFDAKAKPQLRDEYRIRQVTKVTANTLEELVAKLEDTDQEAALKELQAYNKAVRTDIAFNPNVKDGRCTENLEGNKSNWANTPDTPPFEAYAVTCGITLSRSGLEINT